MNNYSFLLEKVAANTEVVGIIGLGYVGFPLAVSFPQAGVNGNSFTNRKLILTSELVYYAMAG